MRFEKWQALGNDYLILERDELPFALTPARVRRLCEGHFGVFADGILLLSPPHDPDDVADLEIYNPDGSQAELSGNGAREAILYLRRRGWTDQDEFSIRTPAGRITPTITGLDTCRVDMGRASLSSKDFPEGPSDGVGEVSAGGRTWRFRHVSIGNPQCAIHVDSEATLAALDLPSIGPSIEADPAFPNRTNVSWYTELAGAPGRANAIRARIFERGAGETLSSGTGASGAAVAHVLGSGMARAPGSTEGGTLVRGMAHAPGSTEGGTLGAHGAAVGRVTVVLDGGELEVEVGEDLHVNLTGWARPVFHGRLSDDFEKELHETE